jgi:hypothetical protein
VWVNWRWLNRHMSNLTEEQVQTLLDQELAGERRGAILRRLHQRVNALRVARERSELCPRP